MTAGYRGLPVAGQTGVLQGGGKSSAGIHTVQILLHFLAGAALAAFLIPEGASAALVGVAVCALMKCAYDYIDCGRVPAAHPAALMAGALLTALVSVAHGMV